MCISPNPCNGRFEIALGQCIEKGSRIRLMVLNAEGAKVYEQFYDGGKNFTVDIGDQASGTYMIELTYQKQMLSEEVVLRKA